MGANFVAHKMAIKGLRYKLRMIRVPLEGPVFCNNESIVKNSSRPESTLKKRHNAIAYHQCREAQAAGVIRIAFEEVKTNIADLFTKIMTQRARANGVMVT
jgi:hypothetical protein